MDFSGSIKVLGLKKYCFQNIGTCMVIFLDFLKLFHSLVDTNPTNERTDHIIKKSKFLAPSEFYQILGHFQNLVN